MLCFNVNMTASSVAPGPSATDVMRYGVHDDAYDAFMQDDVRSIDDVAAFLVADARIVSRLVDLFTGGHMDIPPIRLDATPLDMMVVLMAVHLHDTSDTYFVEHAAAFAIDDLRDTDRFPVTDHASNGTRVQVAMTNARKVSYFYVACASQQSLASHNRTVSVPRVPTWVKIGMDIVRRTGHVRDAVEFLMDELHYA